MLFSLLAFLLWLRFYAAASLDSPETMFSTCPSVRLFVASLVNMIFVNSWTDFSANYHKWSTGQGDKTVNFWGQGVKGQVFTRLRR